MPSSNTPPFICDIDPDTDTNAVNSSDRAPDITAGFLATAFTRAPKAPPWYYQIAIAMLKPLYRLQVWRRSHKRGNYQQEVAQRFGKQYPARPVAKEGLDQHDQRVIWCHAVSLGETNTIAPLLDALLAKGYQLWLTNTTQTGFARGAERFAEEITQGRMSHSYVPVDSPVVIDTFLAHVQPVAALFVETELWANILYQLAKRSIPSILVNGRLSASSFKSYQKIESVSSSMMQNLSLVIAQDTQSAKRFRQLGAYSSQIRVAGSLKWVINTPKGSHQAHSNENTFNRNSLAGNDQAQKFLVDNDRPLWVAASTHKGEESIVLTWQQQLLSESHVANTLLIIVPRHPERFDEVAELIAATGLKMARRSLNESITEQTQIYLADTMGELLHWYEQADVALVAGSLVDIGGHNPVEPASVATPVLMGRYTQSCQSVVNQLAKVGALYQPNNAFYRANSDKGSKDQNNSSVKINSDTQLLYQQLLLWLTHPDQAKQAGQAGAQLTAKQQAVLTQQLTMIEKVISQSRQGVISREAL